MGYTVKPICMDRFQPPTGPQYPRTVPGVVLGLYSQHVIVMHEFRAAVLNRFTNMQDELILITGAGGFIGAALTAEFRRKGHTRIRAVDVKPFEEWYQLFDDVENLPLDLNVQDNCERVARALTKSTISPRTWAAWASSRTTKRSACSRCSSTPICCMAAQKHGVQRYLLFFLGLRLQRRQADGSEQSRP